jgi:hypothetical protein
MLVQNAYVMSSVTIIKLLLNEITFDGISGIKLYLHHSLKAKSTVNLPR